MRIANGEPRIALAAATFSSDHEKTTTSTQKKMFTNLQITIYKKKTSNMNNKF